MSSDEGGLLAQAKVHNEVRGDILRADGRQVGSTIRRDLIEMFVSLNFGPQPVYPGVDFPVAEPDDVVALTDSVAKLVPLGLRVGQREVRSKLGLSDPEAGEELLVARAEPPADPEGRQPGNPPGPAATHAGLRSHVVGCRCGGCLAHLAADPVAADAATLTDALLAEAGRDWREISDPLLAPIAVAMAGASSLDEALAAIGRRGSDGSQLLERLAVATATARGIGDVAD